MELAEHSTEPLLDGPRDADPQSSPECPAQGIDRVTASLRGGQSRAGVREQRFAGVGEPHRASVAVEEDLAQLALEATDLGADRRLGDQHAPRGSSEMALVRDRDKVRELPQFHNDTFYTT
jgi:hypothetical protein